MSLQKFNQGDKVVFINDYGCVFPDRTVTGVEKWEGYDDFRYFIEPTDTPWFSHWFSHKESNLIHVKDDPVVSISAGHKIRYIERDGKKLFVVGTTGIAYITREEAEAFAIQNPNTFIPLYLTLDLADANPPEIGALWRELALAENALAEQLQDLPEGTAVVLEDAYAYFLATATRPGSSEAQRELVRATLSEVRQVSDLVSRYDLADLGWVNVEESDLIAARNDVLLASKTFKRVEFDLKSEEYLDWIAENQPA